MSGNLLLRIAEVADEIEALDKALTQNAAERVTLERKRSELARELGAAKGILAGFDGASVESLATAPGLRRARRRPIRESSTVGWARRVLYTAKGGPMHIDEIVKHIEHMSGMPVSKPTLVSNLSRYVKANDTFRRTAANTYELLPAPEKEIRLVG